MHLPLFLPSSSHHSAKRKATKRGKTSRILWVSVAFKWRPQSWLDYRSKPGSCGKEYTKFYEDLSSKKVNVHLQIQGLGMRASVLLWEWGPGFGLRHNPSFLEFLFGLLIKGQQWECYHQSLGQKEWILDFLNMALHWRDLLDFLVLFVGLVCLLNLISKGHD